MAFAPTLGSALSPTSSVVEVALRVGEGGSSLITVSVKEADRAAWVPRNDIDPSQITWKRGSACTTSGRSNAASTGSEVR